MHMTQYLATALALVLLAGCGGQDHAEEPVGPQSIKCRDLYEEPKAVGWQVLGCLSFGDGPVECPSPPSWTYYACVPSDNPPLAPDIPEHLR